ncbi:hypothetical protein THIOSC13_140003 [uncultured Thiomicrorhabdus sp.]
MLRYRQLVSDTVALDETRGDTLTVVNASFAVAPEEEIENPPIWQESWFWDFVKQFLAGLAVLIIILAVIRPIMRDLSKREEVALEYPEDVPEDVEQVENVDEISKALEKMNAEVEQTAANAEAESKAEHDILEKVRAIVDTNPKVAAHVIRQWMNAGDDNG